ncbi:MAG: Holliday junction resolvase RuvX [Chlamydiae bacterium]|nr:Holliday junction resolvase RuvX [Chlamydiota bacterium]
MQKKIIAIDYGKKRIGLASADSFLKIASPLSTIETSHGHVATIMSILAFIKSQNIEVEKFVIGLPLMLSGQEGPMTALVKQFAKILEDKSGKQVVFYDERLTSSEVENLMRGSDINRKKRKEHTDQLAATLLLQTYLQSFIT